MKTYRAESLDPGRVVLPAPGESASVDVLSVCPAPLAEALLHPERALLPREQFPERVAKPRVWASRDDWIEIVAKQAELGLMVGLRPDQVFAVDNVPVLSGAFGVPKLKGGGSCSASLQIWERMGTLAVSVMVPARSLTRPNLL